MIWLVLALAAYRITRLIVADSITEPLRNRILSQWPTDDSVFTDEWVTETSGEPTTLHDAPVAWLDGEGWIPTAPSKWGELVTCAWCAGFWVACLVTLAVWAVSDLSLEWWVWLALPWASSAITGLLSGWE